MRRTLPLGLLSIAIAWGQADRITQRIDPQRVVRLERHVHPQARVEFDQGPADSTLRINHGVMGFRPSASQQASLDKFLDELQNPASPNYHHWLSPEQFADRFGSSPSDIDQTAAWLRSQGLAVEAPARGRNWLAFSGTAGQVNRAFRTEIHRYFVNGETHYANATPPSVPEALAPHVSGIMGLHDFEPRPAQTILKSPDGSHALAPDDLATIYNIAPLYAAGFDGAGMKIAIVADTNINRSDIDMFRSRFNLPPINLQLVAAGPDPGVISTRLAEADLDIEWTSAVARNANIVFVYSDSALASLQYAVDQNIAPVISHSFIVCELYFSEGAPLLRAMAQQANAQGITIVAASGDAGPAGCETQFYNPVATNGINVNLPASIPEVTGVGGTTFNEGGGNYFSAAPNANGASALSYIPEVAWNDSPVYKALAASAGGPSTLYSKPLWQTGPGVPSDGARDVPDVALTSSANHDGYIFCTAGTCGTSGGDSFAAPVFAGVVALLNQNLVSRGAISQPGLGNINPVLYRMAQNTTDVFHDVTSGDNIVPCMAGTPNCSNGSFGFKAGPGYDLATGLGSIDANRLVTQWDARPETTAVITLTAEPSSVAYSDMIALTATVKPSAGGNLPTGTVSFVLTGQPRLPLQTFVVPSDTLLGTVQLSTAGGVATARLTVNAYQLPLGAAKILAVYNGDMNLNGAAASTTITTTLPSSGGSFVVPSVSPAQAPLVMTLSNGAVWSYQVTLEEVAGVGTTLTGVQINGLDATTSALSFFNSTTIPPKGSITANLGWQGAQLPFTLNFVFSGADSNGTRWSRQLAVPLGPVEQFVRLQYNGLLNGASFRPVFAPGMLASAFGGRLSDAAPAQPSTLPLPTKLGGTTVTVGGTPAPFYYTSGTQLNFQIPYETPPGTAIVTVNSGLQTIQYSITVAPSAPGIFADSKSNLVPTPSGHVGDAVVMFITGDGVPSPAVATGAAPQDVNNLPKPKLPVTLTVGGVEARILFAGIPTWAAGVTQINFVVPSGLVPGVQQVIVKVGDASSAPVNFTVN